MPRVLEKYNMKDLGSARAIKILMQENASLKNALPTAHISTTSTQLTDSAEDLPIENVKLKGQTSQEQYEGRNLLSSSFEQGARSNENGTTLISSYQYVRTSNPIDVQPSTQYVVSLNGELKNGNVHFYNNDTFIRQTSTSSAFSTPNDCNKINIQFYNSAQITPANMGNAQLELGSTVHDYEPYVRTDNQPLIHHIHKQFIGLLVIVMKELQPKIYVMRKVQIRMLLMEVKSFFLQVQII